MIQIVVSLSGGLLLGGMYALIAIGIVLAYRATATFNFAHGQFMALPAFLVGMWQASGRFPFFVALLLALVVAGTIAAFFYLLVLQRTTGLPHFMGLIATLGLASILDGAIAMIFGSNQYTIQITGMPEGTVGMFGARVSREGLILTLITLALAGLIAWLLRATRLGIHIRAAGQDPVLASQGRIPVRLLYAASWAFAGVLAAVAGVAYGSTNLVSPTMVELAFAVFPAILLGGLDSIEGAIVGGLSVGVLQGFTATYLGGAQVDVVTYGFLLLILLIRPGGIFGSAEVRAV